MLTVLSDYSFNFGKNGISELVQCDHKTVHLSVRGQVSEIKYIITKIYTTCMQCFVYAVLLIRLMTPVKGENDLYYIVSQSDFVFVINML